MCPSRTRERFSTYIHITYIHTYYIHTYYIHITYILHTYYIHTYYIHTYILMSPTIQHYSIFLFFVWVIETTPHQKVENSPKRNRWFFLSVILGQAWDWTWNGAFLKSRISIDFSMVRIELDLPHDATWEQIDTGRNSSENSKTTFIYQHIFRITIVQSVNN